MLFRRHCRLIVADDSGQGLDLSELRVAFSVGKADSQTPNEATIAVWNLAAETAGKIAGEFERVVLQAGYDDGFGVIFDGTIKDVRRGIQRGADSILEIYAGDGDEAYNFAVVNQTLAAGSTQADQINAAARSMEPFGVTRGYTGQTGTTKLPRGKVMYGMARDYLRQSAQASEASWSVQDGALRVIPRSGLLPGQAIRLASDTGLIETQRTDDGVNVRALLNPLFTIGGRVVLDDGDDTDGLYRVLLVDHRGDTRGDVWHSLLACVRADSSAPAGQEVTAQ